MKCIAMTLLGLAFCIPTLAQTPSSETGWTEQPLTPDAAETLLENILHGEKTATIQATIGATDEKTVNRGTHCSNSGTINGNVDSDGSVSAQSNGDSNCFALHNYFYWMTLAYIEQPNNGLIIITRCDVRWRWNHCGLPIVGTTDSVVLAREKKGHYAIYIGLRNGSLDRKGTVSKYEIVDLKHFTKSEATP